MKNKLEMAVMASLTLGLAPFTLEPHIWKQLLNIYYGRTMAGIDWFDLFMHGAPWLFLIYVLGTMILKKKV
ncbi:MAG: hypothetical protein P8N52_00820, partial [Crocinitomicaceae bacterium]|nr:hypothetical protein [Crocinitomicaceae bacterium]